MSDSESLPIDPIRLKNLYKYHSNVSREIALVDFLNDGCIQPMTSENETREGTTVYDQEDMYRMGKKQELKVRSPVYV